MSQENVGPQPIGNIQRDITQSGRLSKLQALQKHSIEVESAKNAFQEWSDEASSPINIRRNFETLEVRIRKKTRKEDSQELENEEKIEEDSVTIKDVEKIEFSSESFEQLNPEFDKKGLQVLRARISLRDTPEEILRKVLQSYPDPTLADEAFDFLLQTSQGELAERVGIARALLKKNYDREIRAGKNIENEARAFSLKGLGSPTGLRDLYREITGNPRDANTLFNELTHKFEFKDMQSVSMFLLHSLGADLKAKGSSIAKGELHRLMTECRQLQAFIGLFRFFNSRMKIMQNTMAKNGIAFPVLLTFESLARSFMKFLQERYPSPDKVAQLLKSLGIPDELIAHLIVGMQFRDACRGVAPRLFRSDQHRQDLLMSFIEYLEEIDEQLEEAEEKASRQDDDEEEEE